ncbi:DUF5086 family protein [Rhizobium hidalgonense]|uniref:DUF5086 family protein n=1 Tax=Rhizobium hidalgonense TaxID=1538159 RepID=UPI00287162C6|nr:DUF5086 family protein [Rhizobium hidalgonense]MDR9803145.1 DUF5086 family protein [Rhizobium hidalgonense]
MAANGSRHRSCRRRGPPGRSCLDACRGSKTTGHHRHFSLTTRTVRWATVYKIPDDHYYRVEVIEKERHAPPWQFKRLAALIVVPADALEKGRLRHVESLIAY